MGVCGTGCLVKRWMRPSTGQLTSALKSQALVLVGDFSFPAISWRSHTVQMFLESTDDYFLPQAVEDPTRNSMLLKLTLTIREGLVGDVKPEVSLGCTAYK